MKVLLISINTNERQFGLGSLSLAATARKHYPHDQIDVVQYTMSTPERTILLDILSRDLDVAGFSVHHRNTDAVHRIASALKNIQPGLFLVAGGINVSACFSRNCYDALVTGEGEQAFVEILDGLASGRKGGVAGVSYRSGQGYEDVTFRPFHDPLDDFPSPYLEGVFNEYDQYGCLYLETYRGCVMHCDYCFENRGRERITSYSVERIEEELRFLLEARRVASLEFLDTIFNLKGSRTRRMLEFLARINRGTSLIGSFKLDWLEPEDIALLEPAGFTTIEAGLHSTDDGILARSGRRSDSERFERNARLILEKTDIRLCIDAMYGIGGESLDGFRKTIQTIWDMGAGSRRPLPILFVTHEVPTVNMGSDEAGLCDIDPPMPMLRDPEKRKELPRMYRMLSGHLILRNILRSQAEEVFETITNALGISLAYLFELFGDYLERRSDTSFFLKNANWWDYRGDPFVRQSLSMLGPEIIVEFLSSLEGVSRDEMDVLEARLGVHL